MHLEPEPDAGAAARHRLQHLVADARRRAADLTATRQAAIDAAAGANVDDEHDPEGATLAYEREQLTALVEQARRAERDAEAALLRLADGTYGRCARCGQPIAAARLEARPAAELCLACAGVSR